MNFEVAVPSYRRAQTLAVKTLPMLRRAGVGPDRVTVFVADEEDQVRYESALPPDSYNALVVAEPGMGAVRRFIQNYYNHGTRLLCVDDDVGEIRRKINDKQTEHVDDLPEMVEFAFDVCTQVGATLWGIYPVLNPLFMKNKVTSDLRYIVGCFWGTVNCHEKTLSVTLDDKEDYERTIKHYIQDGAVIRLNHVAPKTSYYSEPGGMQVERTEQRVTDSAVELYKRYPEFCSLNSTKKSGRMELRLKDRSFVRR